MTIADALSHAPPASSGQSVVPTEGPVTGVVKASVNGLDPCRRFTIHDVVTRAPGVANKARRRSLAIALGSLSLTPPGVGAIQRAEDT